MYNVENIKSLVQNTVQTAGDRIRPLEENTRRIIESTTERVKASAVSFDGLRKVEENIKARVEIPDFSNLVQASEITEKLKGIAQSAVLHLDLPTRREADVMREGISKVRKDLYALKRKVDNRALNKDLNALVKRVAALEKANKAS